MTEPRTWNTGALADMLSSALGKEKAEEAIRTALGALQLPAEGLDQIQALQVLERVTAEPGIVGVTARFAKSRLLLQKP